MLDVLESLKAARLFHASRLQLDVIPKHHALSLSGFIRLRHYAPIENDEERFSGAESRQIKAALKSFLPDAVVEVKLEPDVQGFKGGAYLFRISRTFSTKDEMDFAIGKMVQDGTIEEHVFHVNSKWAAEISGGHEH